MNLPANAPASAPKAIKPIDEIRNTLMSEETKKQLLMALPPQIPVERFQRIAITAINKNHELADCSRITLYNAFIQCAQDGLLPDGYEAAIVKYRSKDGAPTAQYQPMIKGILKKIRNSGELKAIMATCIYKNDPFRYWVDDDGEHLTHEPDLFSEDRGAIIGAYALAKTKDDAVYIKVMTKAEIEKVRQSSKAKDSGPWVTWWDQMAEKTVLRRLSKRMPMSTDLEEFMRRDDDLYDPEALNEKAEREPSDKGKKGPGRLKSILGGPGKVIEGKAREVKPHTETQEPAPDAPASESTDEPLVTPDDEPEQTETAQPREKGAFQCAKCDFDTEDKQAMEDHAAAAHGIKPPARPGAAPAPAKKTGNGDSLFQK